MGLQAARQDAQQASLRAATLQQELAEVEDEEIAQSTANLTALNGEREKAKHAEAAKLEAVRKADCEAKAKQEAEQQVEAANKAKNEAVLKANAEVLAKQQAVQRETDANKARTEAETRAQAAEKAEAEAQRAKLEAESQKRQAGQDLTRIQKLPASSTEQPDMMSQLQAKIDSVVEGKLENLKRKSLGGPMLQPINEAQRPKLAGMFSY